MRKKILTMLIVTTMLTVSWPVGIFALTSSDEQQSVVKETAVQDTGSITENAIDTKSTDTKTPDAPGVNGQASEEAEEGSVEAPQSDEPQSDDQSDPEDQTETGEEPQSDDQSGFEEQTEPAVQIDPEDIDPAEEPDQIKTTKPAAAETAHISITAENITMSSADIVWEPVKGAAYYTVVRGDAETVRKDGEALSISMTELSANTEYTVRVIAYGNADSTGGSAAQMLAEGICSFTTLKKEPPAKVRGFRTVSGYNSVKLSWKKSSGIDGYKLYWKGSNGKKGSKELKKTATKYTFKISEKNRKVRYTFRIAAVKDGEESKKASAKDSAVQLMELMVTLKADRTLTAQDGSDASIDLTAGTNIRTIGFANGRYIFQKKIDGKLRMFQVLRIAVQDPEVNYIGRSEGGMVKPVYSAEEAEAFINALSVSSKTKHLIWVNQYSQRLYIFKGSNGKWKLVKQCKEDSDGSAGWLIASGRPASPTATGLTSIRDKKKSNGTPYWSITYYFSIHGNSKSLGSLGWPKSGACVRNTTDHAEWIFYNCKNGTGVYVY